VLEQCRARDLRPIITGGTGLYFKALTEGLAPIPPIPPEIRAAAEAELQRLGPARLHARLAERDPETAAALDRANPARLLRAWEVLETTGTGLAQWRRATPPPPLPLDQTLAIALTPPRPWLHTRCDARFDAMLEQGALDETARVMALGLDPGLPGMKALGAPELMAHLAGALSIDEAVTRAKTATRRYAKRQLTWARNQMRAYTAIESKDPDEIVRLASAMITGDTPER